MHYFELWSSPGEWIARKVLTIQVVNRDTQQHSFSYDVDFLRISQLIDSNGIEGSRVWLPLGAGPRRDFLSVDVDGPWTRQCSLATRRENTAILLYIVIGFLRHQGADLSHLNQADLDRFYEFLRTPDREPVENPYLVSLLAYKNSHGGTSKPIEKISARSILDFFENHEFRQLIAYFTVYYVIVVSVPKSSTVSRGVIKLRTTAGSLRIRRSVFSLLGGPFISSWRFPLSSVGDGTGSLTRVVVPPAMRVIGAHSERSDPKSRKSIRLGLNRIAKSKQSRKMADRETPSIPLDVSFASTEVACHDRGVDSSLAKNLHVDIRLNTKRAVFAFPAFILCQFSYALVALFLLTLPSNDSSVNGLVASVAVVIPAVAASYLLLGQEHEMVSIALGVPRVFLATAMFVLMSSLVVAYGIDGAVEGRVLTLRIGLAALGVLSLYYALAIANPIIRISELRRGVRLWAMAAVIATLFLGTAFLPWKLSPVI